MIDKEILLESTESYLKSLISEVANISIEDKSSSTPFQELGIDSFRVLQIIKKLEEEFGTLPKTLLFENFNISDLSHYFVNKYEQVLVSKFAKENRVSVAPVHSAKTPLKPVEVVSEIATNHVKGASQKTPILILEKEAYKHPELSGLVKKLFNNYKNEGSASRGTRNIAPYLFIGSEKQGYFNYSRSKNIILVYAYTGPRDYFPVIAEEIYHYCTSNNFELTIFAADQIEHIGNVPFSATPFGVVSRVVNIKEFTLQGNKMRRLRYLVSKFEAEGKCKTEEYRSGSNQEIDKNIASIIDQWCAPRTMVNPLIHIVKEEILTGNLSDEHRLFLTYLDDVLQNVILISSLSQEENGYLMDLEFYPNSMPLGGLEFAIVKIIEILAAEGCNILSLGGTYGCKLAPSSNADAELDKTLNYLREQNIFNDEGNLQFKNKFRPENNTIYLCRAVGNSNPDNVIDIIMMIADPSKMQTSDVEHHSPIKSHQLPTTQEDKQEDKIEREDTFKTSEKIDSDKAYQQEGTQDVIIEGIERSIVLSDFSYNPLNIPDHKIEFDLKTDSWAQLEMPAIQNQIKYLYTQLQQPVDLDNSIRNIFPFSYFVLTTCGNTAEHAFFKSWSKKGVVPQNLLFPTTIFNQIDNGFTPKELPHPEVFQLTSEEFYKGNLNWEALQKQVEQDPKSIAFVLIEVDDNAAGGAPVSIQHLRKVKTLLSKYSIPLVIDGTRIVENARFIIEHEKEFAGQTIWDIIREIFSFADAVIASLTKDFCVNKGGLIATNDANLFNNLQNLIQKEGIGLDVVDKKVVAVSLQNRSKIETQALQRIESVRLVWNALKKHGIPVIQPVGGHCILIDVKQIKEFSQFKYPVPSFVAWMFTNTGIRAGAHNVGMQKNTSINNLVRLAIPVGTKTKQTEVIIDRLILLFNRMENIPELVLEGNSSESFGDIYTKFKLIKYHNLSGRIIPKTSILNSSTESKSVSGLDFNSTKTILNRNIAGIKSGQSKDIAIVGMAGRYPKAKNVNELWDNLIQGRDCVGDIPETRLEKRIKFGFTEKYRGGFLEDIDKFDSLFFNISPREAEIMDPQERLFLEVAWEAIEDAGYYPEILADENSSRNIGVFVGAVWAMYQMIGVDEKLAGNKVNPNSFLWSIANRVSYWMNFSGPSLTVDTACSSSLTALYLACEAIYKGDCSSAIVGGVNLDLHQSKFDINSAGGALSKDGVCRTFGDGANGYVAGEGLGAIFLKPLDKAIHDGDNIYGVIKSAVINHGGRSSGYMVTNPKAQTDLILSALENANIDARSMGYIEAHGTGTELGDPIEVSGLVNAFQKYEVKNQSCPIGSVKTNIGHLEAAAGIVGLSKILLQMKHGQLVPSLHSSKLNEFIDFNNSPFYVVQNLEKWCPKEVDGVRFPLRAGISSFGAGGANAHVVIEKYEPFAPANEETFQPGEHFFPLSARNEDQLREMAVRLRDKIQYSLSQTSPALPLNLNDVAYTLQLGRRSFDHRLVVIAKTHEELVEKLTYFIKGKKDEYILVGHRQNAEGITKLLSRKEKEEFIKILSQSRDFRKLTQLWTDGLLDDWQGFQNRNAGRRISLPTYPFADKRHWASSDSKTTLLKHSQTAIHPLIDSNESTFERQIFKKTFHNRNSFIYDYQVSNRPTLPAVVFLDMARKAGEIAAERKIHKIKDIVWSNQLAVENSKQIETLIELKPTASSVQFEIFSEGEDGKKQIYSSGQLSYSAPNKINVEPEFVNLESIQGRCTKAIDCTEVYPFFKSLGLSLGSGFHVLQEVYKGEDEILSVLKISEQQSSDLHNYILYPSLIDGSLQALIGAELGKTSAKIFVPYSIGEIEILFPLQSKCLSYIKILNDANVDGIKADILIIDQEGKVLVKIRDYIGVPLNAAHKELAQKVDADGFSKLYYYQEWEKSSFDKIKSHQNKLEPILLFDTDEKLRNLYQERLKTAGEDVNQIILVQPGNAFEELGEYTYKVNPKNAKDYTRLIQSIHLKKWNIGKICYAWSVPHFIPNESSIKDSLEKGVYSFLFLCQSLVEQKLESKVQLLYLYLGKKDEQQPHNEAINGFAKALQLEHPKLFCKTLEIQQEKINKADVLDAVLTEFHPETQATMSIRYEEQVRYVRKLKNFNLEEVENSCHSQNLKLKEKGVYLITGGTGGLGLIFAEFIAKQCKAKLVITGRSGLSDERKRKLEVLKGLGAEVHYIPNDISNKEEVKELIKEVKVRFGEINGIIHSAGVLRDSFIRNKTQHEMEAVLASKVNGTVFLDEETKNEKLDFFVMFSSLAAVTGNLGQCDYSFANHFMDSFAGRREKLQSKGERSGKTLSINWSLWADGGMQVDDQTEILLKSLGMKPLSTETGVEAFAKGLSIKESQLIVVEGVQEKIELAWGIRKKGPAIELSPAAIISSAAAPNTQETDKKILALIQTELSQIVMQLLKLDANDFTQDAILTDLGFDSIGLTQYANEINKKYQTGITPVLFFEYPSIKEIAKYLSAEHKNEVLEFHQPSIVSNSQVAAVKLAEPTMGMESVEGFHESSSVFKKKWDPIAFDHETVTSSSTRGLSPKDRFVNEPIAIVGISGVMPQSEDLEEFWENLRDGKDMVTLIPKDRWDWEDYFGNPFTQVNKSNSNWGGFMKEVDKFDPLFFGISPREAEMMDPQQRIFLETVWKAIEDSGHKVSDLSGTKTGIFVGLSYKDYVDIMTSSEVLVDGYSASGNATAILANRVSFLLNLRGPSAPLDTACSSSLVALHRAIESIHTGSSDMAIVGGVQVILTPAAHITLSVSGMMSIDGKCKTFDKSANGYVRGEGSGAIFIKPLSKAEADGDHIYAVIKATAENHGGRVTTLTAPNPAAQSELLIEAYEKAHIDPTTVGYIECHGTGTSLGDPIEIQGLKKAFSELYKKHNKAHAENPHCGLSSVKTNIGHLESAAGIAGLLKVLLALKHKQIPALIHFEEINPYINLKDSPFYIVDKTKPWVAIQDEEGAVLPRRAGVSSFGFGGANAHVVLEEYFPPQRQSLSQIVGPQLIVLSAKNKDRLKAYAKLMHKHIQKHRIDLIDFAYTLQVGRDAMEERVGLIVSSLDQLKEKLKAYIDGEQNIEDVYQGRVNRKNEGLSIIGLGQEGDSQETVIEKWVASKNFSKLVDAWVRGLNMDWNKLYSEVKPRRISLPTYPFARERYWFSETKAGGTVLSLPTAQVSSIHPLLQQNTSTLLEQRYTSVFTGNEFFLKDHVVKGAKVLPGVAYLEMARKAVEEAGDSIEDGKMLQLKKVVWAQPIAVNGKPVKVNIGLYAGDKGDISYEVYTESAESDSDPIVHSQGIAQISLASESPWVDIRALRTGAMQGSLNSVQCYEMFQTVGLEYGSSFQGIEDVYVTSDKILAKIKIPTSASEAQGKYILHPSIMDAALQSSIGFALTLGDTGKTDVKPSLPFALDELDIYGKCNTSMWAVIKKSNGNISDKIQKLDIDLCDEEGNVVVRLKGFTSRVLDGAVAATGTKTIGTLMLEPHWEEVKVDGSAVGEGKYEKHIVVLCEPEGVSGEEIERKLRGVQCIIMQSEDASIDKRYGNYAMHLFEEIKKIIENKPRGKVLVQVIIPANGEKQLFAGLSGLIKTAEIENPKIACQIIESDDNRVESIIKKISENTGSLQDKHIRYENGRRLIYTLRELVNKEEAGIPWKDNGVYVITGGAGGLGLIFVKDIVGKIKDARIILTGRSALREEKRSEFIDLEKAGARVEYRQVDVSDKDAVKSLISGVRTQYGHINGIIHSAGIIRDNFIVKKTREEFAEVLVPKVSGLVNIDEASKDISLDFIIVFASIAGAYGNIGQADYAAANAFMDAYAMYRNDLVIRGKRQGKTLSINWPLWKEGGMRIDANSEKMLLQTSGMVPMSTESGILALYKGITCGKSQVAVIEGEINRIKNIFSSQKSTKEKASTENKIVEEIDGNSLRDKVRTALLQAVSNLLKINIENIDVETELNEYGFDSISLTRFTNELNQEYGLDLNPTVFFEHTTISSLSAYLAKDYREVFESRFGKTVRKAISESTKEKASSENKIVEAIDGNSLRDKVQVALLQAVSNLLKINIENIDVETELNEYGFDSISLTRFTNELNQEYGLDLNPTVFFEHTTISSLSAYLAKDYRGVFESRFGGTVRKVIAEERVAEKKEVVASYKSRRNRFSTVVVQEKKREDPEQEPIAIIGVSCRFPMAKNAEEFWNNLKDGKNCISEVPRSRWDWKKFYGDPREEANKTNVKWGGFIEGVEEFDPSFFGISPLEALEMDPNHRLLMTSVWAAIEDAGYSAQSISGSNTGIFVGICASGYSNLLMQADRAIEGHTISALLPSAGPNRMSHFLNLHGPSEPIETACSSSLIAIHRAISAIKNGDCDMAIAGGVNTIVSPEGYVSFSKMGLLCEDGKCKTFSDKADGYVRGEGVGIVLLKKLKKAEESGDHIYGVIRGSAENHGGRAGSLTAPNPKAQAELLKTAYRRAGIDPRAVSYIEAHGTGTPLGDPIEINALKTAFKELYEQSGNAEVNGAHCGIGSVKTNIGYLELASGMAGLIKVLMQMKHKTIVKSLHCDKVNPYIQLEGSPFYLMQEKKEWKRMQDENGKEIPRIAGVSTFGFGGAYAHIVIEEYIGKEESPEVNINSNNPAIIVLSAKNEERLKSYAKEILGYLDGIKKAKGSEKVLCWKFLSKVKNDLIKDIAGVINIQEEEISAEENLEDFCFDIVKYTALKECINKRYNIDIKMSIFKEHSTAESIARYLAKAYVKVLEDYYGDIAYNDVESKLEDIQDNNNKLLREIAYTLQVGRDAMEERIGIIVSSIKELEEKLKGYIDGKDNIEYLYRGQVKKNKEMISVFAADEDMSQIIQIWLDKGKYSKLIDLWVKGLTFDWNNLYGEVKPQRISLPTYPFARERYWVLDTINIDNTKSLLTANVLLTDPSKEITKALAESAIKDEDKSPIA